MKQPSFNFSSPNLSKKLLFLAGVIKGTTIGKDLVGLGDLAELVEGLVLILLADLGVPDQRLLLIAGGQSGKYAMAICWVVASLWRSSI